MKRGIQRIYICGAHSSGKTTLLNDLCPYLGEFKIIEEVARGIIKKHGWTRDDFLPDKHPEVFQQLNEEIVSAQIAIDQECTENEQNFICDRALDPIVYCGFYLGQSAKEAMYQLPGMDTWLNSLRNSLVILVSPHKECITDDQVRLTSTIEELTDFHNMFLLELEQNKIPFANLTVLDRQQRVDIVLKELQQFRIALKSREGLTQ